MASTNSAMRSPARSPTMVAPRMRSLPSIFRWAQFAAFTAAVDLALAEKVDIFLVAGDLFDRKVTLADGSGNAVLEDLGRLLGPVPVAKHRLGPG